MTKTLKERITELEKRMDDFNVRNEEFYAQVKVFLEHQKKSIDTLKAEMEDVRLLAHKHFWMGD